MCYICQGMKLMVVVSINISIVFIERVSGEVQRKEISNGYRKSQRASKMGTEKALRLLALPSPAGTTHEIPSPMLG